MHILTMKTLILKYISNMKNIFYARYKNKTPTNSDYTVKNYSYVYSCFKSQKISKIANQCMLIQTLMHLSRQSAKLVILQYLFKISVMGISNSVRNLMF